MISLIALVGGIVIGLILGVVFDKQIVQKEQLVESDIKAVITKLRALGVKVQDAPAEAVAAVETKVQAEATVVVQDIEKKV